MLKEILTVHRQGNATERLLLSSVYLVVFSYIVHFGLGCFLNSPQDFDHLAGYYEIAWRFWTSQSFPGGFNPFLEGGRTLAGDPQLPIYSPWTLLAGLSPTAAVKIQMLFDLALASWGAWKFFEYLGLTLEQKLWGLFLFLSGGAIVARMTTGHVTLGYLYFIPGILWLSLREKALATAILFIYLGNQRPHFFMYGLPPLFFEVLFRSAFTKNPKPLLIFIAACAASTLANAAWLLPSLQYFQDFPRHDPEEWVRIPLYTYFANLLLPLRALPEVLYGPRFLPRHEYNVFLGPVALFFAYRGFNVLRTHFRPLFFSITLTALLFIWVALGATEDSFSTPYGILYKFWPGFRSVRVPTRFWGYSFFVLVFFSAAGFSTLKTLSSKALVIVLGILPLALSAGVNLSKPTYQAIGSALPGTRSTSNEIVWVDNSVNDQLTHLLKGNGVLQSIQNIVFPRSPLVRAGNALQFQSPDPVTAQFRWRDWSRIEFQIEASKASHVSLNLNAHPYWTITGNGQVRNDYLSAGLTIEVPAGSSKGVLEFKQPMSYEGLITSVLSVGLLLLYIAWMFFNNRQSGPSRRIIGLTGGIGSGKSTVATLFREEGIPVIDMDQLGREIIEKNASVQKKIVELVGEKVSANGAIDRKKVREVVFKDPEKRKSLEQILHPLIWDAFHKQADDYFRTGKRVVICEAALLIENERLSKLDGLIVVMADETTRKKRLLERDKITEELAEQIMKTQVDDEKRKQNATYVIENQAGFYDLKEKVKAIVHQFQ